MALTREELANTPITKISCVSNMFIRMMYFQKAGNIEYGHTHEYDHLTLLARGSLKIIVDGVATEFKAPHMIYIKKDKRHELIALEDSTLAFCVNPLSGVNCTDDIIDPESIPEGVTI